MEKPKIKIDGKKVTMTFTMADEPKLSKSEKSHLMYTTSGYQAVEASDDDLRISINLIKMR